MPWLLLRKSPTALPLFVAAFFAGRAGVGAGVGAPSAGGAPSGIGAGAGVTPGAAALAAIRATADLPRLAVVALAKREEEVFVPGLAAPVRLDPHDPALQLLQRVRDEAHRFALGHHRRRRATRTFASIFDELDGIGPTRRTAILRHFGSAERFLAASREELEGVPGLPAKTARAVHAQLHRTAG